MDKIKVVYGLKQVASSGCENSPSAEKPKLFAEYLQNHEVLKDEVEFIEPEAVSIEDIVSCHNPIFVNSVLELKRPNGFGTISQSVVDSLPYTNGAMYTGAKLALETKRPTCSLVSGFHHAGYNGYETFGYFCTFNGLLVAGEKLIREGACKKIAIIDCDAHYGNGTDDILNYIDPKRERYLHITFGKYFHVEQEAKEYLNYFTHVNTAIVDFKPDLIMYQSGADVHKDDPYGGVLTEEEMKERDRKMFTIAKTLHIPIVWNLAGGYQRDEDGGCSYVLKLHANTFEVCTEVYK